MALSNVSVATSTTSKLILTLPTGGGSVKVYLQNNDATNDIYIGTKSVSASGTNQGLKIAKGGNVYDFLLDGGDQIYAIASAGTPSLTVLWSKN
jgi:hypothetical protein